MEYIISEEELKEKIEHLKLAGFLMGDIKGHVDFILESKQPVELVAEGEVKEPRGSYSEYRIGKKSGELIDDISLTGTYSKDHIGIKILNKVSTGDNIKIYIQKVGKK